MSRAICRAKAEMKVEIIRLSITNKSHPSNRRGQIISNAGNALSLLRSGILSEINRQKPFPCNYATEAERARYSLAAHEKTTTGAGLEFRRTRQRESGVWRSVLEWGKILLRLTLCPENRRSFWPIVKLRAFSCLRPSVAPLAADVSRSERINKSASSSSTDVEHRLQ